MKKYIGDLPKRLCTAAELKFYFTNFIANARSAATFLKPNRNCNSTTWISGCEPGWACSSGLNQPAVNFRDSQEIPARSSDCQPCCEGFFCPQGLTCMIRTCSTIFLFIFSANLSVFLASYHFMQVINGLTVQDLFFFFSSPKFLGC